MLDVGIGGAANRIGTVVEQQAPRRTSTAFTETTPDLDSFESRNYSPQDLVLMRAVGGGAVTPQVRQNGYQTMDRSANAYKGYGSHAFNQLRKAYQSNIDIPAGGNLNICH